MGSGGIPPFASSMRAYERWLSAALDGDLWPDRLREKHRKMRTSAFVFLRATYWRWAETILIICPDLARAPAVLGVADIHLENYGVWRDREGRLVWGVNDFDEAADVPFTVDLVRLAASALLAPHAPRRLVCSNLLAGYRDGLESPQPFVLDERHRKLRALLDASEDGRAEFWRRIDRLRPESRVPARYRAALHAAMPAGDAAIGTFARSAAGTASLGRPRWVAIAEWRGGRLVREAKALAPSAWTRVHPARSRVGPGARMALGRYRAPDPYYLVSPRVVVRRLSPESRKVEADSHASALRDPGVLRAMGHELANVHLGTRDVARRLAKDLDERRDDWLRHAAGTAADFVTDEFEKWRKADPS